MVDKVALGHVFLLKLLFSPINVNSTIVSYSKADASEGKGYKV